MSSKNTSSVFRPNKGSVIFDCDSEDEKDCDGKKNIWAANREETIPSNFKHPERCRIVWNVKEQKHEWRQYMGAGYTCIPEIR